MSLVKKGVYEKIKKKIEEYVGKIQRFLSEVTDLEKEKYNNFRQLFRYTLFLVLLFLLVFSASFVLLITSKKEVPVPNVTNKGLLEASLLLQKRNLSVKISPQFSDEYPPYTVFDQRPRSGIVVKEDRSVQLYVSMGKKLGQMPSFLGSDFQDARARIIDLFSASKSIPKIIQKYEVSEETSGSILEQSPMPGSPLNNDVDIIFLVSTGTKAKRIVIEDYVGQDYDTVSRRLEETGVLVKPIFKSVSDKSKIGKILSQNQAIGESLGQGDSIELSVGVDDLEGTFEQGSEGGEYAYKVYQIPAVVIYNPKLKNVKNSLKKAKDDVLVQMYLDDHLGKRIVFHDTRKRGSTIYVPYHFYGEGYLFITIDGEEQSREKIEAHA